MKNIEFIFTITFMFIYFPFIKKIAILRAGKIRKLLILFLSKSYNSLYWKLWICFLVWEEETIFNIKNSMILNYFIWKNTKFTYFHIKQIQPTIVKCIHNLFAFKSYNSLYWKLLLFVRKEETIPSISHSMILNHIN